MRTTSGTMPYGGVRRKARNSAPADRTMTTTGTVRDWSYREAQRRLRRIARQCLPSHSAHVRLDRVGNRMIDCSCGWRGNGPGWLTHVDQIVCDSLVD